MTGKFIAFEGIDGTGKTTLARMLAARLSVPVTLTKQLDPTEALGAELRRILFETVTSHRIAVDAISCLFLADHIQRTEKLIIPALRGGRAVVADRTVYSNVAYGRAIGMSDHMAAAWRGAHGPEPDLIFLLVGDPVQLLKRANGREETHQKGKAWNNAELQFSIQKTLRAHLASANYVLVTALGMTPERIMEHIIWPHVVRLLGDIDSGSRQTKAA